MSDESPRELLPRIAAGDESAVQECVERFGGMVWSLSRRWSADAADAEDAVQEVFFELWKSAGRFDASRASEQGFVAMIARRRLIDRARKRSRRPALEPLPEGFDAPSEGHEVAEQRLYFERARALLDQLTPAQKRVLQLSLLEGKTHEEIAQETGMPLGTVKSHVRRGLKKARALAAQAEAAESEGI